MGIDCSSIHTTEVLRMQLCGLNQEDDQVMRYGRLLAVGVVKTHTNILSIGMNSIDETKVDIGNNNIMPEGSNSRFKNIKEELGDKLKITDIILTSDEVNSKTVMKL